MAWTCPETRSCVAGDSPQYGTWFVGDPGEDIEQLARQLMRGATASQRRNRSAGFGLRVGDKFGKRLGLDLPRIDHDHLRRRRDQRDRDKILLDIVVELEEDRRRDGMMRRADEEG